VSDQPKSYHLSLVRGRTDLLRIPEDLAADLGGEGAVTGMASIAPGHKLPVRINLRDRTILGLGPWLKRQAEEGAESVVLHIVSKKPFQCAVALSSKRPDSPTHAEPLAIERPSDGLYLGAKLSPQFFELVRTTEPVILQETDLLQQAFICGAVGSGKTVLGKILIEEAARRGIPVIAIDLKGDISSMGVLCSGEDATELVPWVVPQKEETPEVAAAAAAERQKANLRRWGVGETDVLEFDKKVAVNVFTPRSNAGFRLALSAFVEFPSDIEEIKVRDPDSFELTIQFMVQTFVARLQLTRRQADKARGYVYEIVKHYMEEGESLRGYEGIKRVLDEIRKGELCISQIGGMPTEEFITAKDRVDIAAAMNTLLTGAQKLWFQGFPLDIEGLLDEKHYGGKTPVSIINLTHLSFVDQAYVVGYVAYQIWFWMRQLKGVERPRLLFYIDEIGGGGSKEAFFPSVAISPSKPALNLLIRQGRAFGVCCVFATQAPGDIDYKALGQCGTWAIGQLRTKLDRSKIEQGAGIADYDFEAASQHIASLGTGQFVIRSPSLAWTVFEERWLMHLHRVMSRQDIERLKSEYEQEVEALYAQAQAAAASGKLREARGLLESILNGYRFSSRCAAAYLMLGNVLYDMGEFETALGVLGKMIVARLEAEETGEAHFLSGKCHERLGRFADADRDFAKVSESAATEETKTSAAQHQEYCKNRLLWPTLTQIEKLCWWVSGRKPDADELVALEVGDKDLRSSLYSCVIERADVDIPEPIDYAALLAAGDEARADEVARTAEQVKAQRWAVDQIVKIEEYLANQALSQAEGPCKRIVSRLADSGALAPPSVVTVLKKFNAAGEEKRQISFRTRVLQLEARQFEFEMANLFRHLGYFSTVTQVTADGGVDVFASNSEERVVIQCKRWDRAVGRDKVDELAGVRSRHAAPRAILAATAGFSDAAKDAAREHGIELWDLNRIQQEWRRVLGANPI